VSQANVDRAGRLIAAMNAREISDQLADELLAPRYRIENASSAVSDNTYHGIDGVREWIRERFEAFDDAARFEVAETLAHGDDFVVSRLRLVGHGALSGAPLVFGWVDVTWFEDGKMTRSTGHNRRRDALKAVGQE
jgi:ketosteroid isomerase-like protein